MKKTCLLLLSAELLLGSYAFAATPEITLSGRKDRVLSFKMRALVLDVAETYLNQADEGFVASIEGVENPYAFKGAEAEAVVSPRTIATTKTATVAAPVVYDDASMLQGVALSVAKQVRGTLSRGATHYLQFQGGGMLKSGSSFVAQVEGESFTVTITDVNSDGYTLKMGDASLTVPFDVSSGVSAGATKDSAK